MAEDEQIPFNNRTHDRLTELEKKVEERGDNFKIYNTYAEMDVRVKNLENREIAKGKRMNTMSIELAEMKSWEDYLSHGGLLEQIMEKVEKLGDTLQKCGVKWDFRLDEHQGSISELKTSLSIEKQKSYQGWKAHSDKIKELKLDKMFIRDTHDKHAFQIAELKEQFEEHLCGEYILREVMLEFMLRVGDSFNGVNDDPLLYIDLIKKLGEATPYANGQGKLTGGEKDYTETIKNLKDISKRYERDGLPDEDSKSPRLAGSARQTDDKCNKLGHIFMNNVCKYCDMSVLTWKYEERPPDATGIVVEKADLEVVFEYADGWVSQNIFSVDPKFKEYEEMKEKYLPEDTK